MSHARWPCRRFSAAVAVLAAVVLAMSPCPRYAAAELQMLELSTAGEPLRSPVVVQAAGDAVAQVDANLVFAPTRYVGPSLTANIATLNGDTPGPTIRVRAGDRLTLTLSNDLGPQPDANFAHNSFCCPNSTNIHLHGPHISGMPPGDDIFQHVGPKESHTYRYVIEDNHMPGTHWYHPHFHGATSLQTGMGAAGALIVEDPPGYLPDEIASMPEVIMMLQHIDLPVMYNAAQVSLMNWYDHPGIEYTNVTTNATDLVLINGQFKPTIAMEAGVWYRWRLIMSSVIESVIFAPDSGNCSLQLLAKDGIYLSDAPRQVPWIVMSPGNRADVAVRCSEAGSFGLLTTEGGTHRQEFLPADPANIPGKTGEFTEQSTLGTLLVTGAGAGQPDLSPFSVTRPCYLVDLTALDAAAVDQTFSIDFTWYLPPDEPGRSIGGINDQPWVNASTFLKTYNLGTVQELQLRNIGLHPYHQHVNPFQLMAIDSANASTNSSVGGWYMPGDWHDTLMHPETTAQADVRFAADRFMGNMVLHCHFLTHEDQGMMGQFYLNGTEGDSWAGARSVDPQCTLPSPTLGVDQIRVPGDDAGDDDDSDNSGTVPPASALPALLAVIPLLAWII